MLSQRETDLLKKFQNLPRDFVVNGAHHAYREFRDGLLAELQPSGILETVIAEEIVSASWRLRRCSENEADLALTIQEKSEFDSPSIRHVGRARNAAAKLLFQALNQLRRLQTARISQLQNEPKSNNKPAPLHKPSKPSLRKTNPIVAISSNPPKSRRAPPPRSP